MSNPDTFRADLMVGKHAFITGGTSGINLGIAHRLARAGARCTLLGRNADKAHRAAGAVTAASGREALAVIADVRDPVSLGATLEQGHSRFGPIDILVCGAAGNFPAPALGMSPNGFKAVIDIDLLGTFNACRLAFDHLTKPGACILNVSAPQAFLPTMMQSHVCAAKAGVDMITKTLALEWGGAGVRVNSIAPGAVDGTEGMARLAPDEASRARITRSLPAQRFAQVEDIADVALFLCSDAARYVTGAVIVADGGLSLVGFNALLAG